MCSCVHKRSSRGIVMKPKSVANLLGNVFVANGNFVGITGKIGNVVTGNNFWELISMGLPESLAGSQRSVRRCELVTNKDYRKYR